MNSYGMVSQKQLIELYPTMNVLLPVKKCNEMNIWNVQQSISYVSVCV